MSTELTAQTELVAQLEPAYKISFDLKHGKRALSLTIKAWKPDELLEKYQAALNAFAGLADAPAPAAAAKKAEKTANSEAATEAKPLSKTKAAVQAKDEALTWNETALKWANRVITALPHFNNYTPQKLADQLGCGKAMAVMTVEESQRFVGLCKDVIVAAGHNDASIAAYGEIIGVIDMLKTGSEEEWQAAKADIPDTVWSALNQNKKLFDAAKAELEARRNFLQVAALASQS